MEGQAVLAIAAILFIGTAAQWLGWRLRVPAIVFLLAAGLLVGPITGALDPDEMLGDLMFPIVSLAVAVILFEGALGLGVKGIRDAGSTVWSLLTIGVTVTLVATAAFASVIFGIDYKLSLVLGAVLVVTGPTVIGPLVRSIGLRGKVGRILEAEGTLVDPLGAIIAVLFFEAFFEPESSGSWVVDLIVIAGVGVTAGVLGAALIAWTFSRYLVPDHLHNVTTLSVVTIVFALVEQVRPEAGLVAVTVMGVALAAQNRVSVQHILEFNETLRTIFISGLFVLLGARIAPETLSSLGWKNAAFLAVMVLLVRPVSVLLSTIGSGLTRSEKGFIAATAPRGIVAAAVASVFSIRLSEIEVENAQILVAATFTIIAGTVVLSGFGARPLANRLGLIDPDQMRTVILGSNRLARELAKRLAEQGALVTLIGMDWKNLTSARMEGLTTHWGSVLNEDTWTAAHLQEAQIFLAMSSQDEVNALATRHAAEEIGRRNVFQLVPHGKGSGPWRPGSAQTYGRTLFTANANIDTIEANLESGWEVAATKLTDSFKARDYFKAHPEAVPLAKIHDHRVHIREASRRLMLRPGDTVIALRPDPDAPAG